MMENRSAYGYYGDGHGATGEKPPKVHKSGWRMMDFCFATKGCGNYNVLITACDYVHAVKNAQVAAKRGGYEIVGDAEGWEYQRNW